MNSITELRLQRPVGIQRWRKSHILARLHDVVILPAISHPGNVNDIIGKCGSSDRLRSAPIAVIRSVN